MKMIFQKIRDAIRSRRKSPKEQMRLVPISDYEILKLIRISMATGKEINFVSFESLFPNQNVNELHYHNAKILNQYYGVSKEDVFYLTGCML